MPYDSLIPRRPYRLPTQGRRGCPVTPATERTAAAQACPGRWGQGHAHPQPRRRHKPAAMPFCQEPVTLCRHAQEIVLRCGTSEACAPGAVSGRHATASAAVRPAAQHAGSPDRSGRSVAAGAAGCLPDGHRDRDPGPAGYGCASVCGSTERDHRVSRRAAPSSKLTRAGLGGCAYPLERQEAERRVRPGAPDEADPGTGYVTGQLRFTAPPRAVADAARTLTRFDDVRHVVCAVVQQRACTVAELTEELQAGPPLVPPCSVRRWQRSATASGRWQRETCGS